MKLFTRLIDSGVFVFWSEDECDANFNLKIRIAVGDEKITLVDINPSIGQNYYTFDRVGSGDYEIELNAFRNDILYQTETKKIKIISSIQKNEEAMQTILDSLYVLNAEISAAMSNTNSNIVDLYNLLLKVKKALTDPETIVENRQRLQRYEKRGW